MKGIRRINHCAASALALATMISGSAAVPAGRPQDPKAKKVVPAPPETEASIKQKFDDAIGTGSAGGKKDFPDVNVVANQVYDPTKQVFNVFVSGAVPFGKVSIVRSRAEQERKKFGGPKDTVTVNVLYSGLYQNDPVGTTIANLLTNSFADDLPDRSVIVDKSVGIAANRNADNTYDISITGSVATGKRDPIVEQATKTFDRLAAKTPGLLGKLDLTALTETAQAAPADQSQQIAEYFQTRLADDLSLLASAGDTNLSLPSVAGLLQVQVKKGFGGAYNVLIYAPLDGSGMAHLQAAANEIKAELAPKAKVSDPPAHKYPAPNAPIGKVVAPGGNSRAGADAGGGAPAGTPGGVNCVVYIAHMSDVQASAALSALFTSAFAQNLGGAYPSATASTPAAGQTAGSGAAGAMPSTAGAAASPVTLNSTVTVGATPGASTTSTSAPSSGAAAGASGTAQGANAPAVIGIAPLGNPAAATAPAVTVIVKPRVDVNSPFKVVVTAKSPTGDQIETVSAIMKALESQLTTSGIKVATNLVDNHIIQRRWKIRFLPSPAVGSAAATGGGTTPATPAAAGTATPAANVNLTVNSSNTGGGTGSSAGGASGGSGASGSSGSGSGTGAGSSGGGTGSGASGSGSGATGSGTSGSGSGAGGSGNAGGAGGASPATNVSTPPDDIDKMVAALNAAYATPDSKTPIVRDKFDLWITGPKNQVQKIVGVLAMTDTTWQRVNLEMWPIQMSGDEKQIAANVKTISNSIRSTEKEIEQLTVQLQVALAKSSGFQYQSATTSADDSKSISPDDLFKKLAKLGFDHHPDSPLSLIENLFLMGLSNDRHTLVKDFAQNALDGWKGEADQLQKKLAAEKRLQEKLQDPEQIRLTSWQLASLLTRIHRFDPSYGVPVKPKMPVVKPTLPFENLRKVFDSNLTGVDRKGLALFTEAAERYHRYVLLLDKGEEVSGDIESAPFELSRESATVDEQVRQTINAYTADLQEIYLDPLLTGIQTELKVRSSGLSLAGKSSISVTSGLEGDLTAQMVSYANATQVAPYNLSSLTSGTLTLGTILATTPYAGLLDLAAGLANGATVAPVFTTVSPGINAFARPTVLPDSTEARLELKFQFGFSTMAPSLAGRTDVFATRPPDAVAMHTVNTDTVVNGFNLFDVSSFVIETSAPQAPNYIPILGRLPIIGPAFQGARGNKITYHASMVLVNATIFPRALSLLNFYESTKGGANH